MGRDCNQRICRTTLSASILHLKTALHASQYLRRPLHRDIVLIGEVRRPGVHHRTVLHRLSDGLRKASLTRTATLRTDLDLGPMRRHFDPDRRNIEYLALFIPHRLDTPQGGLTMPTVEDLMRFNPIRSLWSQQRLTVMVRLPAIGLVAGLP